ncbi:MAG: double-strand break repair protein AddB [Rhodospirillaceae bacterium]
MTDKTVYTIPPNTPFVDALADGLMARTGGDPAALMDYTVLLPTRRAVRSLREAFLRLSGGKPLLLPRLYPLGDLDEDELAISEAGDGAHVAAAELPPAIGGLKRQLLLTRMVQKFEQGQAGTDQAAQLARELGRLLDQVQTERLSFDGLENLVPEDFAEHWQLTLDFLKILTDTWPAILEEQGALDAVDRRNRLLERQTRLWAEHPPSGPIIAAGSTGSIPATADLLTLVAGLPDSAVVLPGLDTSLGEDDAEGLDEDHPQYGMVHLVHQMGLSIGDVGLWESELVKPLNPRVDLLHRVMSPAAATDRWRDEDAPGEAAMAGLSVADFESPEEESVAIALMMRQALETPERTAALVTPDRSLARRAAAELRRWDIEIDDSAGQPLANTPPGMFLKLTAEAVADEFSPLSLLALFKHPLAAGGQASAALRDWVRAIEIAALRGPRPEAGLEGLKKALTKEQHQPLIPWLETMAAAAAPFAALMREDTVALPDLVDSHITFAEAMAADDQTTGPDRLWRGEDGEAAANFATELIDAAGSLGDMPPGDYPALLETLMSGRAVRPRYGRHPRLNIWGLLEARLQHADLIILGGLNEGTWPPDTQSDPWMSRPMRQRFGLPLPERRIGLTAHDFAQAACAKEVILTRARRVDGSPTVPARWRLRLDRFLDGFDLRTALHPSDPWEYWQSILDASDGYAPVSPPAPRPPLAARPTQLSVTQVETWMRDPYAVYARHILGLRALLPLDAAPDAADYGSLIHHSLDDFLTAFPADAPLPDDALDHLIGFGEKQFESVIAYPGVAAFWWPRFLRIADWFVAHERLSRNGITAIASEINGEMKISQDESDFTLTGFADRIDTLADGTLRIIDYKTGAPPSKKEVAAGFAPQLPLEAVIAESGSFKDLPAGKVAALDYWRLGGGRQAGDIKDAGDDIAALTAEALDGLKALIRDFAREETPYLARPRPDAAPKYSDYEHLARIKEWMVAGGGDQ